MADTINTPEGLTLDSSSTQDHMAPAQDFNVDSHQSHVAPQDFTVDAAHKPSTTTGLILSETDNEIGPGMLPQAAMDTWKDIKHFMATGDERAAMRLALTFSTAGVGRAIVSKGAENTVGAFGGKLIQGEGKNSLVGLGYEELQKRATALEEAMLNESDPVRKGFLQRQLDNVDNALSKTPEGKYENAVTKQIMDRGGISQRDQYDLAFKQQQIDEAVAQTKKDLRDTAIKEGAPLYWGSRVKDLESAITSLKDKPNMEAEIATIKDQIARIKQGNPGSVTPLLETFKRIEPDKTYRPRDVIAWLEQAGAKIIDKQVRGQDGTIYIKFADPANPTKEGLATPRVRIPLDEHSARYVRPGEHGGLLIDTGKISNRPTSANVNASGGSYSEWQNLVDALKWRLSKSPDGNFLISPGQEPIPRTVKRGPPSKPTEKDPNQLELPLE